jgi:hypothetical protein
MVASDLGRQETNTILEKLDQMEVKYDAFITFDEEASGEEEALGKDRRLDVAKEGKKVGTLSNPIALDIDA